MILYFESDRIDNVPKKNDAARSIINNKFFGEFVNQSFDVDVGDYIFVSTYQRLDFQFEWEYMRPK